MVLIQVNPLLDLSSNREFVKAITGTRVRYTRGCSQYETIIEEKQIVYGGFKKFPWQWQPNRWWQVIEFEPHIEALITEEERNYMKAQREQEEQIVKHNMVEIMRELNARLKSKG